MFKSAHYSLALGIAKFSSYQSFTAFKHSISFDEKGFFEVMERKIFSPFYFATFFNSSRHLYNFSLQVFEISSFCHQKWKTRIHITKLYLYVQEFHNRTFIFKWSSGDLEEPASYMSNASSPSHFSCLLLDSPVSQHLFCTQRGEDQLGLFQVQPLVCKIKGKNHVLQPSVCLCHR